jgi:DNA repair exonuclease SbcCD ATPase subunit
MQELKIGSVEIDNFKAIKHIEIEAAGNNIVLRGKNGIGKTSVFEAITTALQGKCALPDNAIKIGEESSLIKLRLIDGTDARFTIAVSVTGENMYLRIKTFDQDGHELTVSKPAEFLEKIVGSLTFDPTSFRHMKDKEQLEFLFDIIPGLRNKITEVDTKVEAIKVERSAINKEVARLEVDLDRSKEYPGLPEKEIDPAELMKELESIENYNKDLLAVCELLDSYKKKLVSEREQVELIRVDVEHKKEMIKMFTTAIADAEASIIKKQNSMLDTQKAVSDHVEYLAKNPPKSTDSIKAQISESQKTNEMIRSNQKVTLLADEIAKKKGSYAAKGQEIKALEETRFKVVNEFNLPIDGLSIGEASCTPTPQPATRSSSMHFLPASFGVLQ